jgi:hypothetical protein
MANEELTMNWWIALNTIIGIYQISWDFYRLEDTNFLEMYVIARKFN